MNIYLVRHAQSFCNISNEHTYIYSSNSSLTNYGILQAKSFAEYYKNLNIDIIYTSPLVRAIQTADIIRKNFEIEKFYKDVRLSEMITLEDTIYSSPDVWDKILDERVQFPSKIINGIESLENQYERMISFLSDIKNTNFNNVLVVTHAFNIECTLAYILGIPLEKLKQTRFKISNMGLFLIEIGDCFNYIKLCNGLSHIEVI